MNRSGRNFDEEKKPAKDWKSRPELNGIDPQKLELLQTLAAQGSGKSQQELLPFLMAAASKSQSDGVRFSSAEVQAVLEALKAGKSPQEAEKLDRIVLLMNMMRR